MNLNELKPGQSAVITAVGGAGALRQHFLDMGVIPGAEITLMQFAPMGDPMELRLHGYELTLRLADAEKIAVRLAEDANTAAPDAPARVHDAEHPGLGQGGRYHAKADGNPLPEGTALTFALAGNQNCGKTTLFNQLTGSNQHVGNFPGVTVDRKSGAIRGDQNTLVTDLPGIYSLSPYSAEEIVSRQFILEEKPTGIINIVDATNIERNLYLTLQLMELDTPIVLALNMMDEVNGNGGTIRVNEMEQLLGIPVVPISAARNEGIDELIDHALHVARYQEKPGRTDFCDEREHSGSVHRCLHGIMALIEDHALDAGIPLRFAASKLVEGDTMVAEEDRTEPLEVRGGPRGEPAAHPFFPSRQRAAGFQGRLQCPRRLLPDGEERDLRAHIRRDAVPEEREMRAGQEQHVRLLRADRGEFRLHGGARQRVVGGKMSLLRQRNERLAGLCEDLRVRPARQQRARECAAADRRLRGGDGDVPAL